MSVRNQAIRRLIEAEQLPENFAGMVDRFYRPLAEHLAQRQARAKRMIVAGICGPQGSGKSTMAAFLKLLLDASGLPTAVLALDDFYLTHTERQRLAREVHPLLATRGPPGTHDVAMGLGLLDALKGATPGTRTPIPRFDKSKDDRAPESGWSHFVGRPAIVLFEGWCVGARPQEPADLAAPINELELTRDPDGTWRRYLNAHLAGPYRKWFARIDHLTMLRPPGFECVLEWRVLQEEKLRAKPGSGAALMSRDEIAHFIQHYERITRHILREMPARADAIVDIDAKHRLTGLSFRT